MKNIKELLTKISTMGIKAKIITGVVAITLVTGTIAGGVYLYNNATKGNDSSLTQQENTDNSKEEREDTENKEGEIVQNTENENKEENVENVENKDSEDKDKEDVVTPETPTTGGTDSSSDGNSNNSEKPNNNGSTSNSGSSNNGGTSSNGGSSTPQPPKPTPQPPKPSVNVGLDTDLTNELNKMNIQYTATYLGVKKGEFTELAKQVALGNKSTSEVINIISNMTWDEKASSVDSFYPSKVTNVTTFDVRCNKFTVDGNMSASDISAKNQINLGPFGAVFAYRNSDNSVTVTSLSSNFMVNL